MSNPDWPGPYWQDDAGSGRRGRDDDQSAWDDSGFWRAGEGRGADRHGGSRNGHADERPRRANRAVEGTRRAGASAAGMFSQTAENLKSRLGNSARGRGRSGAADDGADADFWGESPARPGRSGDRARAGNNSAGRAGAGRGSAGRPGAGRNSANWDEPTQGWRANAPGGNGYRGSRRASASTAAYGAAGPGQYGDGRTALRDRIQDGVRNRTSTMPRRGGRGDGGGGRWDDYRPQPRGRWERFTHYWRSGKWWRHWTWKKVFGLIGGAVAFCVLAAALAIFIIYEKTPIPRASELTANWSSSTVTFANGKQMGVFDTFNGSTVDRQILTVNQIPSIMNKAMVAAEDRNFWNEGGISITGLVRSAYDDILGSGNLQGGSTITMQYAKNYYAGVNSGQNASTKLKEIFIAMKLAHKKSKQWILTSYLNTVPFGPTIDGVGAAAENYFGINLAEGGKKNQLTYSQAAVLAAMPNSPGFLSPDPTAGAGYTALKARWHYVLDNMVKDNAITQQQADTAVFPKYTPPKQSGYSGVNGYLMEMVKQQLEAPTSVGGFGLTEKQIATGGYRITTTFSMKQIKALAHAVNEEKAVMRQQAAAGSGVAMRNYDHIGAALIDPKTGAITAIYGGPGFLSSSKQCAKVDCQINSAEVPQEVGSSFKPYVLSAAVNQDMNVFSSVLDGIAPMYIPTVPADVKSTELAPSVASPLPGAQIKPGGNFWTPDNKYYYKIKAGCDSASVCRPLPVNVATATSSDPAFMDLAHRVGISGVIDMAGKFGVGASPFLYPTGCSKANNSSFTYKDTLQACNDFSGQNGIQTMFSPKKYSKYYFKQGFPGSPQIALGEAPLTPIEQASTFATLADGGVYHTPHVIASISSTTSSAPNVFYRPHQVLSPAGAADVDWALSFDNNMAGATAMGTVTYHPGGIIAKTGTIGNGDTTFDAWFVGAVPKQQAMAVDLYANDPGIEREVLNQLPYTPSGMRGSLGGAWPASIWNAFFTNQFPSTSYQQVNQIFPTTNGYPFVPWIQAKAAPKKQNCGGGGDQGNQGNCKCKHGFGFFGQPCQGGGNPNPNPNPTSPNPNPTSTCFPPGQCNGNGPTPTPQPTTPSPSPSPTCTTGQCNSPPQGGGHANTTAALSLTVASAAARLTAADQAYAAKLERLVLIT